MLKIKIGISSCLLGKKVRYNGRDSLDRYVKETLGRYFEWVPVCPEVEYGLPVPREPMHLVGDPSNPRLVTVRTGVDHTGGMIRWTKRKLGEMEQDDLCGFIFKSKSPSSGIRGVKVHTESGTFVSKGAGLFGASFMRRFPLVPVIDEGGFSKPLLRENFIEKVFVFKRWKDYLSRGGSIPDLIDFHAAHRLIILSHSPKHLISLGRLVANPQRYALKNLQFRYIRTFMDGLHLFATVTKNTNVLLHIVRYFKKNLKPDEERELLQVIEKYHKGHIPIIVPMTLINHYVKKFDEPYLKIQYYLNPDPLELMLRNHS